jgi:hypothetical protein
MVVLILPVSQIYPPKIKRFRETEFVMTEMGRFEAQGERSYQ